MIRRSSASLAFLAVLAMFLMGVTASAAEIKSPSDFLGHKVGEDRYLAPYPKVIEYLKHLGAESPRISVEPAGESTLGNEIVVVVLTSEKNQENLEEIRGITQRLANPDGLGDKEAAELIARGKAVVLITCSIHSTEVGSTQMAMEFAHTLATTSDARILRWMDDVVLLLMPSINPDGQIMVVDWYNKYLGTAFEGGRMPWLYHHYVGHDNNRDFYMLTQKESRSVNEVLYHRWFPQVFLDEHQMGSTGPRMFVPPQADPLAVEIDSMIFRQADILGTAMSMRLEGAGKRGVGHDMIFDSYWPGGTRNTAWWKNVTGLLSEVASAKLATPIFVEQGELRGGGKGFPEYSRRSNYPSPWEGGWWRLRDIMDYELVATMSLLETSSIYRNEFLSTFYKLSKQGIEQGTAGPPYGFIIPPGQHDPTATSDLVDLLLTHAIRVEQADKPFAVGRARYEAGSYVVRAAQPYRPFLLTMLRPQRYPEVIPHVGGPILEPYDVASWSLPLSMGVEIHEASDPIPGSFTRIVEASRPSPPPEQTEAGAGGYRISHGDTAVFKLMNRLLARGKKAYWLQEASSRGIRGDLYIPPDQIDAVEMADLIRTTGAGVTALRARPTGAAYLARPVRVGLYKPWVASMDEGWTRFLLDNHEFDYVNLSNKELVDGSFAGKVDVIIFPDVRKSIIKEGKPSKERSRRFTPLPPEYSGGLGEEGAAHLKKWVVEKGGSVIGLDSSTAYLIDLLDLPVTNVLEKVKRKTFACPGSMLRINLDTTLPVTYGMRSEEAAYFANSPAFATRPPDSRFERRVIASYPEDEKDILVSGYLKGGKLLERRAAAVDYKVMKGRAILIGFRAQHRAQPVRTFKLLFNAIFLHALEPVDL